MSVCLPHVCECLWSPEEGVRASGAGVSDGYNQFEVSAGNRGKTTHTLNC